MTHAPPPEEGARVAVLGAGVAGLSCAVELASRGVPCDVFDQGSRGVGGRASSSRPATVAAAAAAAAGGGEPLVFDHGCQFFTASHPAFKAVCEKLRAQGHVERWDGRFGSLHAETGAFTPKKKSVTRDDDQNAAAATQQSAPASVAEGGDFFGLLSADEVFVGTPTMQGLCEGLRAMAPAAVGHWHVTVTSLERDEDAAAADTADAADAAVADAAADDAKTTPPPPPPPPPPPSTTTRSCWSVCGVDHRQLDEGEAGSGVRPLGRFAAVAVTDVMMAKRGTPGSCTLSLPPSLSVPSSASPAVPASVAAGAEAASAVDGYAVRAADCPGTLMVTAAASSGGELVPGEAVYVAAGTPVPPGADAVVPLAQTDKLQSPFGAAVYVPAAVAPGAHVRPGDVGMTAGRAWDTMERMEPGSLFSLMVAFPQELGVGAGAGAGAGAAGFDAAVVVGSEVVQLLVRNTSKPGRSGGGRSRAGDGLECWVAISTKAFAEKVVAGAPLSVNGEYNPQTAAYLEAVTPTMVAEVRRLLRESREEGGKGLDVPELVHAKSQRWGNAFPMTTTMLGGGGGGGGGGGSRGGFIWDGASGFAACGDFVVGAGVEAAFLSGLGAGAAIAEALSSSDC